MRYFIKENGIETEINPKYQAEDRYDMRGEFGTTYNKNREWYYNIVAKPEFSYKPNINLVALYTFSIAGLIWGWFLGIINNIWNDYSLFQNIGVWSVIMFVFFMLRDVFIKNRSERKKSKIFNNSKFKDIDYDWVEKDSNGDRYMIFETDEDTDDRQIKLSEEEYDFFTNFEYELTSQQYLIPENIWVSIDYMFDKASPTLKKDLKINNSIIIYYKD